MKKFLFLALAAFTLITLSQSCKKKVSDADLATNVTKALTDKGMAGTKVEVKDGVATISGECKDDKCKTECEAIAKEVKGVKSVVNSCTVAPVPVSTTVVASTDMKVQETVKAGLKDIKGITGVTFEGNKAVVAGAVTDADRLKIKQILDASKVVADFSKLTKK